MAEIALPQIATFIIIASVSILVQSILGFAGALTAMPILVMFISPKDAIPAYCLLLLVIDLFLLLEARCHIQWGSAGKLLIGGLCGAPVGAYGLAKLSSHWISLGISVVTLVFAILFLLKVKLHTKDRLTTQLGIGLISGLLGGSTTMSGAPVVIFGVTQKWDKNTFRATLLAYFFFLGLEVIIIFATLGLLTKWSVIASSATILPACLAAWLGVLVKRNVSEILFKRAVLSMIVLVSVIGILHKVI